ncbi:MAG: hypothetical protein ABII06_16035 [Pseudomonadota bacterium]
MDSEPRHPLHSLSKIRDNSILLVMGNAYLCEVPFLRKIGLSLDAHVQKLKGDIQSLKKAYPGKFAHEVNTDDILKVIHILAQHLQNPDQSMSEKCTIGELGRELEGHVDALTLAVHKIKGQVQGKTPVYTRKDSVLHTVGKVQSTGAYLAGPLRFIAKVVIIFLVLAILPFAYLYLTLDDEEDLLKEIARSEAFIGTQRELLSEKTSEKEEFNKKIEAVREAEQNRQDKIGVLELNMELNKIDEEMRKLDILIHIQNKKIQDNRKKIEEMKTKPFLKRLLRL